jgi:NAD+ synthase
MSTTPKPIASGIDALSIDTDVVIGLLCGFLHDEVVKVGYDRVCIGLSGGVDSAVAAALACRALGAANVFPVLLPYRTSSASSEGHARLVCEQLGMTPQIVDISPQIDAYFAERPEAGDTRRGNKMARERMTVLYDVSESEHALVVGTANKTELLLGYGTIHGDMAHALNPLGDLYKTQVFLLAHALAVDPLIIDKPPSADLWEGQSDEADLGFTYSAVDALLYQMVDGRATPADLVSWGFERTFVDQISTRVRESQYKRRPPLIAKLSARTIDREFRYPRDWGR